MRLLMIVEGEPATSEPGLVVVTPLSFEAFYVRAWPKLAGLAALLVGSTSAGVEIADEVLSRMYARWDGIVDPLPYAQVSVRNLAWATRRRKEREHFATEPSAIEQDGGPEGALDVRRALRRIGRAQREVIVLRYYAGLTDEEIASTLRCRAGTVKSRIRRGLEALRKELSE